MSSSLNSFRIAFIQAGWHQGIVNQANAGFFSELEAHGVDVTGVDCVEVPGAFEIPLKSQSLARSGQYQAIVAAGLVVDGDIYRHEFVAQSVINGLMQIQLASEVPILSVVLTPKEVFLQEGAQGSEAQIEFFTQHFFMKGQEAARAVIELLAPKNS